MRSSFMLAIGCVLTSAALQAQNVDPQPPAKQNAIATSPVQLSDARLGAWNPGTDEESRWLVVRATVTNPTAAELVIPVTAWKLTADGEEYASQPLDGSPDAPPGDTTVIVGEGVTLKSQELKLPAGKSGTTWLTFPDLPAGTHVPLMTLDCQPNDDVQLKVDLNALAAQRLGLTVERLGPGNALAMLTIDGKLDTLTVGTLVDKIEELLSQDQLRFVVALPADSFSTDVEVLGWLHEVARTSGLSEMFHHRFASLPTERMVFHLFSPTLNDRADNEKPADWWLRNSHRSVELAVIAAIRPLCRLAPRGALLQEIRSGHPLSRQAVLIHGAQKLAASDLPLLLKLTGDPSSGIRRSAVTALRHFGEDTAIEALVRLAGADSATADADTDDADVVSTAATNSLAASRYSVAHARLAELLQQDAPKLRARVLDAMSRTPRKAWSEPLYQLATTGDQSVRVQVLSALTAVGHPRLAGLLRECLQDTDASLSAAALEQLMQRNDQESEQLARQWTLRQLETTPPSRAVLLFLKRTRDARAVPLLMKYLEEEPSKQRVALIETILAIGDERTAAELGGRFGNLNGAERRLVINALHSAGSPLFRKLAEQVMTEDDSKTVDQVAAFLAEDASPWAVELLSKALSRTSRKKRFFELSRALAAIASPAARDVLRKAASPEAKKFRGAAKQSLFLLYQNSPAMQFVVQGQSAYEEDNPTLALLHFELAVKVDPELPVARQERANMILRLPDATPERLQVAREDFTRLVQIDPEDSFGHTGLSLVDVRLGNIERGLSSSEKLRASHGEDSVFLYNMACIYGQAINALESQDNPPDDRDELISEYRRKALLDLRSSIDAGLDEYNVEWMTRDPDLKAIRVSPEFNKLFESDADPDANPAGAPEENDADLPAIPAELEPAPAGAPAAAA